MFLGNSWGVSKEFARAVLVYGTDELRVKERAAEHARVMVPAGEWGTEIVDCWQDNAESAVSAIERAIEALLTPPFLGGEQFVWLKNVSFFADTETVKISGNQSVEATVQKLVSILEKPLADNLRVLISAPGAKVDRKAKDENASAFGKLKKLKHFLVEDFNLPTSSPFQSSFAPVAEVRERLSAAGLRIHPEALEILSRMSGPDPRQMQMEIEKLIAYCQGRNEVTPADVTDIVTPTAEETFWNWCDAVIEFRTADALQLLAQLKFQQENPVGLMINLINHARLAMKVRLLADMKLLGSGGAIGQGEELLVPVGERKSAPSAWRIKRVSAQVRDYPLVVWERFFESVYDCYASFFETGNDHFTMLRDLVLSLHIDTVKKE